MLLPCLHSVFGGKNNSVAIVAIRSARYPVIHWFYSSPAFERGKAEIAINAEDYKKSRTLRLLGGCSTEQICCSTHFQWQPC